MTPIEIWSKISEHQLAGIMMHAQMADYFDFLGLMGFKREQEYHYFVESAAMRGVHRYCINHHNKLITGGHPVNPSIIPAMWNNYTRFDVDTNTRKKSIIEAFEKWKSWEKETKNFYCNMFTECTNQGYVADANKINKLIRDVDHELKCLERRIIELRAVDYDAVYIMEIQNCLHEYYKEKTKEIGVNIC